MQKLAREKYDTDYHVQVCTPGRESKFSAADAKTGAAKTAAAQS